MRVLNRLFRISLFTFSLWFLASCVSPEDEKYSKETEDRITQVENSLSGWMELEGSSDNTWTLQERMKYFKVNGLSLAVIKDYKIDWARGYGFADSAREIPVTVNTLFQAASISKSLNGVGVLKLVQDKKLDLYTDINDYLSSWKFPYDSLSGGKKITVANLLSHTAGLSIHGFPGYERGDTLPSLPEILDGRQPANTKAVRSEFEPGLRVQYSGGGTTISQLIIQDITQQPYDVYMQENVLDPLGMTLSSYSQPPAADREKYLATAYRADGKEVEKQYHIYPEQAAAGLWTNPKDLARYIIETQLSLEGRSAKVLSEEMTKLQLTPYVDSSAALGVFINKTGGIRYFGHGGANEGFRSNYTGSMEGGNGVVVMVNSDNGAIMNEVINSVAKVYGWKDYYKPVVKKEVPVADSLLNLYAGDYTIEEDTVHLSKKEEKMVLRINSREPEAMYFTSPDEFVIRSMNYEFRFNRDQAGKVTDFYFKNGGETVRLKRL